MHLYSKTKLNRIFDMSGEHSKYTIWKLYFDDSQINRYNLIEDNFIYLFDTSNDGYDGKNINYLNKILCEGVGLLYPYFNNLKSDIIGFESYRRIFYHNYNLLDIQQILNGKIQVFTNYNVKDYFPNNKYIYKDTVNHFYFWKIIENGFYDDFIEYIKLNYPLYLESLKKIHRFHNFSMFVCTWNNYIELCNFIWGYFNYIADKYHFNVYEEYNWVNFIQKHFIDFNHNHHIENTFVNWNPKYPYGYNNWYTEQYESSNHFKYGLYRIFSFNIEYIVSMFANYKGYIYNQDNKCIFIPM